MKFTAHLLLLSSLLAQLICVATAEKLIRKREEVALLPLPTKMIATVNFGRVVQEMNLDESSSYSFSYSYSISYPESYSYPMTFVPSHSPTVENGVMDAQSGVTPGPSQAPTDSLVTATIAPFDPNSNDFAQPIRSGSPNPSSSPTSDQTPEITVSTVEKTKGNEGTVVSNGERPQENLNGSAIIIPVVGIVAGMAILGAAVFAIDRRNGPIAYQNLDGDSQSSFSLA